MGPQIQHIDGAPGSTSTPRGDRITMYVESLAGTLSGADGDARIRNDTLKAAPRNGFLR
ncbi:hypothetical protein [Streptomyces canus]|uniref:hypothetical protein n=1 Tax=Streptomyces canus TaxID=58343 RepID=UPI002784A5E1|nr:hypothetical protein [Streptomyces canus]MDQ0764875.1 hypothetical protein [Streptomyces canus]MDQ1066685.1 hypothetical protein [Streptomyces canus]